MVMEKNPYTIYNVIVRTYLNNLLAIEG